MKVRVKDIAEAAGVSSATVSNALNGKGGVGEDLSRKIFSLAREMGYIHERSAFSHRDYIRLVLFRRHGLVVMDTQFFADMINGITREAHQLGYELMISHIDMEKDADYPERIDEICREECSGIILMATEMYREDLQLFSHSKAPLLVLDSLFRLDEFNCVCINNYEAGYMATQRLIAMGHTAIEHVTASVRFNNMRYRRQGFEAAMSESHLPIGEDYLWRVKPTVEGAYRDMLELLNARKKPMPTALFVANDNMAMGCMRALKEKGYKIPQDVSLIGMDDLDTCQIANPPLSTIRVFREDISRIAVHRLADMMNPAMPQTIQKTEVSVTLVDRRSIRDMHEN